MSYIPDVKCKNKLNSFFSYRYNGLLTPFAFEKVELQYELAPNVIFLSFDDIEAVVNNKNNDIVSPTRCSCLFFSSMELPCRHILQFFIMNEMDPFEPQLCAIRWTNNYYNDSHPALSSHIQINSTMPVYVQVRNSSEINQFKKSDAITKEIRNIATNLPSNEHIFFLDKLKDLRNEMMNSSSSPIVVSDNCTGEQEGNAVNTLKKCLWICR